MNFQDLSWPDSRQFRPERFLDEDGKFKKNDNFVAFSLGKIFFFKFSLISFNLFKFQAISSNLLKFQSIPIKTSSFLFLLIGFVFFAGRRQCPGEALARTEIFVLISRILQKFRITCADHLPDDVLLRGHFGVTYMPPKFRLQFDKVTD